MSEVSREMPKYRSHKKVWALKIKSIEINPRDTSKDVNGMSDPNEPGRIGTITPEDDNYAPFHIDEAYIAKHKPQEGGYYIVYEDGYKSFSPAEAFEGGYTRI